MKAFNTKLFNNRFLGQRERFLESKQALYQEVFKELNVKQLIDLLDTEFKNENDNGYTSSNAFNIRTKLDNFERGVFRHRDHIGKLIQDLTYEVSESKKLNDIDAQKLKQDSEALRLEARYDWYGKMRTFLFSIMGAALFVATLFTVGYIEKNYEWAVLPLAKYVEVNPEKLTTQNVSDLKLTNPAFETSKMVDKSVKPIDKTIPDNQK